MVRREGEAQAAHVQLAHPRVGQPVKGAAAQSAALQGALFFQSQDGRARGGFADVKGGQGLDQDAQPDFPPTGEDVLPVQAKNGQVWVDRDAQFAFLSGFNIRHFSYGR